VSEALLALRDRVERLFAAGAGADRDAARAAFVELREALSRGEARAAQPDPASPTGWQVNSWVKQGILLGFRFGELADASMDHGRVPFFDKDTLPLKRLDVAAGVRIVPGGSSVRDGSFLGRGVIGMPPMYVNIGAYVDEGSMIDSHAHLAMFPDAERDSVLAQLQKEVEQVGRERVRPCHVGSSYLLKRLKNRFSQLLGSLLLSLVALHQLQIRLHRGCC